MRNFIEFIRSRGIVGLMVGFILGKGMSDLVGTFVDSLINPLVGLITNRFGNLSDWVWKLSTVSFTYGKLISSLINFLILAVVVYMIYKVLGLERLDKEEAAKK